MALTAEQRHVLHGALDRYLRTYPTVVWSDEVGGFRRLDSMYTVERWIAARLRSTDRARLKEGLLSVLAWGWANDGRQRYRCNLFANSVTDRQLDSFTELAQGPIDVSVQSVRALRLPQFSQMAFISKLEAFWDPAQFVVLDSRIAKLARADMPVLADLKTYPTSIPVTGHNAKIYGRWCTYARRLAAEVGSSRAVDGERAIFQLIVEGQLALAAEAVHSIETQGPT